MENFIKSSLQEAQKALGDFLGREENLLLLDKAISQMVKTLKGQGRILSCGNGGSMCDSMHFAEELTGRYRKDRAPLAAMAMGDPSHLTCVSNDFGFDEVFARNVLAWGRPGDTLLVISTSGNSPNCLRATEAAREQGMQVVGLLGKGGGKLKDKVDVPVIVEHSTTDRIQEIHIKIIHIMIEGIERALFPQHYSP